MIFRLQLKPYQMTGLNWLVLMHEQKMNGILADEMVNMPLQFMVCVFLNEELCYKDLQTQLFILILT